MTQPGVDISGAYKKCYKMNVVGRKGCTTTIAIPPEVIDLKAREAGLTPEEFIRRYRMAAYYDNFDGIIYKFEEIKE